MASNIVPGNVDGTYPKAGQDNSSQGLEITSQRSRTTLQKPRQRLIVYKQTRLHLTDLVTSTTTKY